MLSVSTACAFVMCHAVLAMLLTPEGARASWPGSQGLATQGFITVNWSHVQSTINKTLDLNKDG